MIDNSLDDQKLETKKNLSEAMLNEHVKKLPKQLFVYLNSDSLKTFLCCFFLVYDLRTDNVAVYRLQS